MKRMLALQSTLQQLRLLNRQRWSVRDIGRRRWWRNVKGWRRRRDRGKLRRPKELGERVKRLRRSEQRRKSARRLRYQLHAGGSQFSWCKG